MLSRTRQHLLSDWPTVDDEVKLQVSHHCLIANLRVHIERFGGVQFNSEPQPGR